MCCASPGWRGGKHSDRIALELFLKAFDLLAHAIEMGVDGERGFERLERRPLVLEREIDLTEAGKGAEMARLEGEGAFDIGDARVIIAHQIFNRRLLVPTLGEVAIPRYHDIEGRQR